MPVWTALSAGLRSGSGGTACRCWHKTGTSLQHGSFFLFKGWPHLKINTAWRRWTKSQVACQSVRKAMRWSSTQKLRGSISGVWSPQWQTRCFYTTGTISQILEIREEWCSFLLIRIAGSRNHFSSQNALLRNLFSTFFRVKKPLKTLSTTDVRDHWLVVLNY